VAARRGGEAPCAHGALSPKPSTPRTRQAPPPTHPAVTLAPLMQTSPTSPCGSTAPSASRTATDTPPCARPTLPGLRGPCLGRGLLVIWWEASVMAYASSTGTCGAGTAGAAVEGGVYGGAARR
jgi:hypothetical protein